MTEHRLLKKGNVFQGKKIVPLQSTLPCVGIVGRANVGKSTLFNRISGKALAITADYEGVTRDWQSFQGKLFDFNFTVLDTPGLGIKDSFFEPSIKIILEDLFSYCQCIIFMVDGSQGINAVDQNILQWLRKQSRPILLVANKCERFKDELQALDFSQWGLGEPIPISALHGQGLWKLKEALSAILSKETSILDSVSFDNQLFTPQTIENPLSTDGCNEENDCKTADYEKAFFGSTRSLVKTSDDISSDVSFTLSEKGIRVAVMGRPNAGKSTFINVCLGMERLLTGPIAGITRDSVEVPLLMGNTPFIFIDTAGARKQAKAKNFLEQLSRASGQRALIFSHVTLLCIDGTRGLEKQDLTLLSSIIEEGRAVAVGLTKWDQIKNKNSYLKSLRKCLDESVLSGRWIPLFPFSSINRKGLEELCSGLKDLYIRWNRRIATGPLNRWMTDCLQDTPAPMINGTLIKLKYITQIKTRPPRFVIFGNQVDALPLHYQRYLLNRLVQTFHLEGVNARISYRTGKNPYEPVKNP